MDKKIIGSAAILGGTAVILGAFGAHALKQALPAESLATFETGVRYQMYHALFLLFTGTSGFPDPRAKRAIYYLTLTGIVLFSGSIYLLATDSLNAFNFKIIGFVTPIGGLLLIMAWIILFVAVLRRKS